MENQDHEEQQEYVIDLQGLSEVFLKLAQDLTTGFTNHLEQLREHLDDDTLNVNALVDSAPSQQIARVTGNLITIGNGIKNGLTQEPPKP